MLENTSMFSFKMTIFLFFTIAVMIMERYIYKSLIKKVTRKSTKVDSSSGDFDK